MSQQCIELAQTAVYWVGIESSVLSWCRQQLTSSQEKFRHKFICRGQPIRAKIVVLCEIIKIIQKITLEYKMTSIAIVCLLGIMIDEGQEDQRLWEVQRSSQARPTLFCHTNSFLKEVLLWQLVKLDRSKNYKLPSLYNGNLFSLHVAFLIKKKRIKYLCAIHRNHRNPLK